MSTDVAFDGIYEGPFNVDASDHLACEFVFLTQLDEFSDAALKGGDVVGDEGGQDGIATVLDEALAGVMERFGGEVVAIEVGAGVAIDLKIERFHA
jgi:hypothetical protein